MVTPLLHPVDGLLNLGSMSVDGNPGLTGAGLICNKDTHTQTHTYIYICIRFTSFFSVFFDKFYAYFSLSIALVVIQWYYHVRYTE